MNCEKFINEIIDLVLENLTKNTESWNQENFEHLKSKVGEILKLKTKR